MFEEMKLSKHVIEVDCYIHHVKWSHNMGKLDLKKKFGVAKKKVFLDGRMRDSFLVKNTSSSAHFAPIFNAVC